MAFKKPIELSALCAKSRNEMLNISPAANPCTRYKQYIEYEQIVRQLSPTYKTVKLPKIIKKKNDDLEEAEPLKVRGRIQDHKQRP